MRHEELEYDWMCADGGIDMHCHMELRLSLDPENGDIKTLDRVACEKVLLHSPDGIERIRETRVISWLVMDFVNQYAINRHNLKDDVQLKVSEKFPAIY